jgi:hypothetical protein
LLSKGVDSGAVKGMSDVSRFDQAAIASLRISNGTFRIAIAAPEKIVRTGFGAGWNVFKRFHNVRWEWDMRGCPGLCLIEQQAVAIEAMPLQRHRIANAQPTATHQQRHGAKTHLIRPQVSATALAPADVGCGQKGHNVQITHKIARPFCPWKISC